jgi:hypothetical protein
MKRTILTLAFALAGTAGAHAQVTVDGNYDAAYGTAKSVVTYNPAAPTSNFGTPGPSSNAIGYTIWLTSDADNVYGLFKASGPGAAAFTGGNLYFDIDLTEANGTGSDLGFQLASTHTNAFVPNESVNVAVSGIQYAQSADGLSFEFSIANSLFLNQIAGINYDPGVVMPTLGTKIQLRLSQSYGYSVAGGASFGSNRLGEVILGGVPEPASWAMMLGGFGLVGGALRRRKAVAALA